MTQLGRYPAVIVAAMLAACGGGGGSQDLSASTAEANAKAGATKYKLNLSHIECVGDDVVNAHFVLLFTGDTAVPETFEGTYNEGLTFTATRDRQTGNVWHYNAEFASGYIAIKTATVTVNGYPVALHNPEAYANDYDCGANACVVPTDSAGYLATSESGLLCTDQPLGSETNECAYFGLVLIGKTDFEKQSIKTAAAEMDAPLVLVKTGSQACGGGEAAYQVYLDGVSQGDALTTPTYIGPSGKPTQQDISHVTYCRCK